MANYISVKEASNKWGYSENTIRKWCRNGDIYITLKAKKESTADKITIENGSWKYPKCGTVNQNYVGTCSCGQAR